jgi:hypothetical protein
MSIYYEWGKKEADGVIPADSWFLFVLGSLAFSLSSCRLYNLEPSSRGYSG